jgi:2-polyprenyl-6-methoxyphenol hydroxylase-like FAD-dependent oxidoreductase
MIIGGGIAGCALALFLKRVGIDATIFEAYPRDQACEGGVGGGLQVAPNGMNVLHHLGLADQLRSVGVECPAMSFDNQHGSQLARVPIDPNLEYGQPAVNMTRSALHHALIQAVEKEGIPIEFDKRLTHLAGLSPEEEDEGIVTAHFEDGTVAMGDFVVGADGAHSRTRALVLGDEDPKAKFIGLMTSGGFVHTDALLDQPESDQGTMHFLLGPEGRILGYARPSAYDPRLVMWWRNTYVGDHWKDDQDPGGGGEGQWNGRTPTKDELNAIDTDELKRRILDVPGGWSPLARQMVTDTEVILRGTVHTVASLPRWYSGRAVLIGDAAHAVSPHSGQGASLALEDAMYLAKMLRLALRHDSPGAAKDAVDAQVLESAFRAFQEGRKERAEKIVAEGMRRGEPRRTKSEQPPGAIRQWCTELLLKALFRWLVPLSLREVHAYSIKWDD